MKADKTPLDRALWKLIDEHMTELVIALLILVSVLIRALLAPNTELSPDYTFYCLDWVNKYREMGIAGGLSITMGDYYTPLNLMYASCALFDCEPWLPLAIYSCTFEYIGTYFLYRILKLLLEEKGAAGAGKRAALAAVLTLFLPHTIINSALWKQCDSIYFCFILISLWEMLREKYAAGFVFLAVSFAVKLQAVFYIPFYVAMYIAKRKYSIFNFFWIPAVYLIAGIPAVLCRHGLRATYLTYLYQTQEGVTEGYGMTAYYPNVYVFGLDDHYDLLSTPAVLLTLALLMALALMINRFRSGLNMQNMVLVCCVLAWTCLMWLPSMHERYDYGIVILITALSLLPDAKLWPCAAVLNFCTVISHGITVFGAEKMKVLQYPAAAANILAWGCAAVLLVLRLKSCSSKPADVIKSRLVA